MVAPRTSSIHLLGPQRQSPTVRDALAPLLEPGQPVAAVTAGWEEREAEHSELSEHLERPVEALELYRRAEDVFRRDPELLRAWRDRRDLLRQLQTLYRVRLRHLGPATETLLRRKGSPALLDPERASAFEGLRALDAHYLRRTEEVETTWRASQRLADHPDLGRHREELAGILDRTSALCIAGGHVGILKDHLWLFDVLDRVAPDVPIVAWSAGAMALAEQVVLFHDTPPQGRGYAEVYARGLGLFSGLVPLPHARRRLLLDDPVRVQLLARRFPDDLCVALDEGARIGWEAGRWSASEGVRQLRPDGTLAPLEDAGEDA